jgi:hypothetical protein
VSWHHGKHDSQMVLMRFLKKVHFDTPIVAAEARHRPRHGKHHRCASSTRPTYLHPPCISLPALPISTRPAYLLSPNSHLPTQLPPALKTLQNSEVCMVKRQAVITLIFLTVMLSKAGKVSERQRPGTMASTIPRPHLLWYHSPEPDPPRRPHHPGRNLHPPSRYLYRSSQVGAYRMDGHLHPRHPCFLILATRQFLVG